MPETFINSLARRWSRLVLRWPGILLALLTAATGLLGWYASGLELRSDFKELLPQESQAVRDYNQYRDRLGGVGNFIVVVENRNFDAARGYVDALVAALEEKTPPGQIEYIDYRATAQREFFEKNKYLYVDVEDLVTIRERLRTKIEWETICSNPMYIDIAGDCDEDPGFTFDDIQDKYRALGRRYDHYLENYYTSADGSLIAILIKPSHDAASVTNVEAFLKAVEPVIQSIDPAAFDPSIQLRYTGAFMMAYGEYKAIFNDILSTAALCFVLVLLALVLYFRRFRTIYLIFSGVIFGLVWMFALTRHQYGFLNSVTGFLGIVVLGNGINNAIVLVARYLEERRRGEEMPEAMETALASTLRATFVAAFTTAAAYATLVISDMQGHKQFGVIGSFGMAACWLATFLVVPPLICLSERFRPISPEGYAESRIRVGDWIYKSVRRYPQGWISAGALLTVAGTVCLGLFLRDPWEEDYTKVRSQSSLRSGYQATNRLIMERIFDLSLTPAAVLVDDPEDVPAVVAELERRRETPDSIIDSIRYVAGFVPDRQGEKLAVLDDIRELMDGQALRFLNAGQRTEVDRIRESISLEKITVDDLPDEIVRNFREKDGSFDKVIYVFPDNSRELVYKSNLQAYVDSVRHIRLDNGKEVTSASEQTLVIDTINLTIETAPVVVCLAYGLVLLLVAVLFPSARAIITLMITLTAGFLMIFMGFYGLNQKLTFFNFIALPLTIGIGIDYGTNIYSRYELDGRGSIRDVLRTTGGAVMLCSVTTVIGYLSLLIANNLMLVYFGWLCLIGEITTVFTAIVLLPAWLLWRERRELVMPPAG